MATPAYQGQGQPAADSGGGLFGRLGSIFAGSTPNYAGVAQAASTGSSGAVVAYAPAPAPKPESTSDATSIDANAEVMTCPIDPAALAAGHIAIVIPRERLGLCTETE